jgi:hypothetical protein
MLSIVEAMDDPGLFQPWFRGATWNGWRSILRAAYALPMSDDDRTFFRSVADRDPPARRVREAWFIAGRRSGKDSIASLITAHSAAMFDRKQGKLRRGEKALCSCLASDRDQSKIVLNYVRSYFDDTNSGHNIVATVFLAGDLYVSGLWPDRDASGRRDGICERDSGLMRQRILRQDQGGRRYCRAR